MQACTRTHSAVRHRDATGLQRACRLRDMTVNRSAQALARCRRPQMTETNSSGFKSVFRCLPWHPSRDCVQEFEHAWMASSASVMWSLHTSQVCWCAEAID